MKYRCECGKEFENARSFNGHKCHCEQHHLKKYGNLDKLFSMRTQFSINTHAAQKLKSELNHKQNVEIWISEKHICEHCGKVMTEKYGSGRFCCRACANARKHSDETKQKIKLTRLKGKEIDEKTGRALKTFTCCVCGKEFKHYKQVKTCSRKCLTKLKSDKFRGNSFGGLKPGSAKNYKYGWYKNISCDSSYELAYVVYCFDHNISIKRNTEAFQYIYNNKQYNYYPDFICDDMYVEIKNYSTEIVQAKIKYFPKDRKYKILYKQDLAIYIDYCKNTYGQDFCEILYDKTKPSYLDKNVKK